MEQHLQRVRALSPERRRRLGETLAAWSAAQAPPVRSLALFYVAPDGVAPGEVKAFLESRLPDHLLPSEFVRVAELPRTVTGKVDRRALREGGAPAADEEEPAAPAGASPPSTGTELRLADIWRRVLGVGEIGAGQSFFELGGHSLLATQVVMEIEQVFGLRVPLNTLFQHRTLSRLARHLDELPPPEDRSAVAARARDDGEAPLSNAQRRLWYGSQLTERGLEYKILKVLELEGTLNAATVAQAVEEIVRRHEALRTRFVYANGKLVQEVVPARAFRVEMVELGGLDERAGAAAQARIEEEIRQRPFDLERGPLLRITLVRSGERRARLFFDAHHIVIDGWSVGILVSELNTLARAFAAGEPSPLAPLPAQYRDYALDERERVGQDDLAAQLAYWRRKLDGVPPLELGGARPASLAAGPDGETDFEMGGGLLAAVSRACAELEVTPFMFFTAAYYALLAGHAPARDVAIGTDLANRDSLEHAGLIGFFSNQLVLRLCAGDDVPFAELCRRTRECVLEAFAHKDLPYDALVRALGGGGRAREPLFRAKFVFHHAIPDIAIPGIRTRFVEIKPPMGKFDLLLNVQEGGDGFVGKLEYGGAVLDEAAAAAMAEEFTALCHLAASDPATTVGALASAAAAARAERSRRELEHAREERRRGLLERIRAGGAPA